jgi:O-antigen/teichoic acid export membrane protein
MLGAAGVGLLSQANLFATIFTIMGSLGMVNSMMQQVSFLREKKDSQNQSKIQSTVLVSQLILSFVITLILLFTTPLLPSILFKNNSSELKYGLICIILSLPLTVVSSNYIEGFFTAYNRFDLYVKASSWATIFGVISFIPAVYYWGILGAMTNVLASAIFLFLFFLYYVSKIERLENIFRIQFSRSAFKSLFKDGTINLVCVVFLTSISLLLRNLIIRNYGLAENGIYQLSLSMTAYYTPFLTNPLWVKYFPSISAKGICDETKQVIQSTLEFIILATSFIVLMIMMLPDLIIYILATAEFAKAKYYLPIQLVGDIWYFIFFAYTTLQLAKREMVQYLFGWIIFSVIQYVLAWIMIPHIGILGVSFSYALSCFIVGSIALYRFHEILASPTYESKHIKMLSICMVLVILSGVSVYFNYSVIYRFALLLVFVLGYLYFSKKTTLTYFKYKNEPN